MNIPITPIESSQIFAIGFDAPSKTLRVRFKNKAGPTSIYDYDLSKIEEPQKFFDEFLAAESKGRFFGQRIRNNADFTYQKIEPEAEQKPTEEQAASQG